MSSYEEIRPRELKPAVLELDGISRASVEAHYKLYQGYVNKRNEILGKLGAADLGNANQIYSDIRALKVELSFAVGGIKNHEVYFEHLGGGGGDPKGAIADLIKRYPKAQVRDFDGNPDRITEADALIAYLQHLGTLVDFKLFNDKANIR